MWNVALKNITFQPKILLFPNIAILKVPPNSSGIVEKQEFLCYWAIIH